MLPVVSNVVTSVFEVVSTILIFPLAVHTRDLSVASSGVIVAVTVFNAYKSTEEISLKLTPLTVTRVGITFTEAVSFLPLLAVTVIVTVPSAPETVEIVPSATVARLESLVSYVYVSESAFVEIERATVFPPTILSE